MTYVVYEPPFPTPILATNAKAAAWRFACQMSHAIVVGVAQGLVTGAAHFVRGRRVAVQPPNPSDVSARWTARACSVHGLVELPPRGIDPPERALLEQNK